MALHTCLDGIVERYASIMSSEDWMTKSCWLQLMPVPLCDYSQLS